MNTSTYSSDSNKCGILSVQQFDKNLGQYLKVIVIRKELGGHFCFC